MTRSKIEWCDRSDWNPLRGCTRVSPGCGGPGPHGGCYAEAIAARFSDPGQPFHGFAERTKSGPRWTGKVELIEERLTAPLRWRKPARIFALSMSDLFHESVPDEWLERIFSVMAHAPQHTYQILTKRAGRMRDYVKKFWSDNDRDMPDNWWFGVSCEDQSRADERIPLLLDTPAAVRWVSLEPMLGPVDLTKIEIKLGEQSRMWESALQARDGLNKGGEKHRLDWVIVGGESGPGARPMEISWAYSIVQQCKAAQVPCFVKQMGGNAISTGAAGADPDGIYRYRYRDRKGGDWFEWLPELRVREYPAQERA